MAKFIKSVVDRVNFLTKKGLTGYHSPQQICAELHAESMNTWRTYVKEFEKTQVMDTYLRSFQFAETVVLTDGIGTIVSKDYLYYFEGYDGTNKTEMHEVDNRKFRFRASDPVKTPTAKYPICSNFNQQLEVIPANAFPQAIISYLKKPTLPVYAYSTSGDRYIYDDDNSVDWEWHETMADLIVDKALANLGINIRSGEVINFSNQQRQLDQQ